MNWENLAIILIYFAIFATFITAIIEVVKGISAIGLWSAFTGLIKTLWKNDPMKSEAFPVLNFAIALLCCWAFNVTIMQYLFSNLLKIQNASGNWQAFAAKWLDYFGTASLTYLGSDQLFKRFLDVERSAKTFVMETTESIGFKKEQSS